MDLSYDCYPISLETVEKIVVKVGTSTLTHKTGKLDLLQMEKLVRELADLANLGKKLVLVTSGAVGAGVGRLGLGRRPRTLPEKQAIAAVGQGLLLHMYEKLFAEYGRIVAQVLLTREDFSDRRRYLNVRHTFFKLLEFEVIPIVNENDTIAVDELRFGDNDNLAALVAASVDADLLVLLSDIDGLYTGNPHQDPEARRIPVIREITPEIEALAGGVGSSLASGGMGTKIQAARIAANSGIPMLIAHGAEENVIHRILQGEDLGTLFVPKEGKLHAKKKWIAFGSAVQGRLTIDAGAVRALVEEGKSLLPIGITEVEENFEAGAVVSVVGPDQVEVARGIVNYSSSALKKIKGKKTAEIEKILGYKDYDEVIHRDNLALWEIHS
jgi:glutamate 5-kinase